MGDGRRTTTSGESNMKIEARRDETDNCPTTRHDNTILDNAANAINQWQQQDDDNDQKKEWFGFVP
jgi:hypothetical protein